MLRLTLPEPRAGLVSAFSAPMYVSSVLFSHSPVITKHEVELNRPEDECYRVQTFHMQEGTFAKTSSQRAGRGGPRRRGRTRRPPPSSRAYLPADAQPHPVSCRTFFRGSSDKKIPWEVKTLKVFRLSLPLSRYGPVTVTES
jgi:hypothetical protein